MSTTIFCKREMIALTRRLLGFLMHVDAKSTKHSCAHSNNFNHLQIIVNINSKTIVLHTIKKIMYNEPQHGVSNNVVCVTSKGSDQPAHTRSLIRAFAGRLNTL